MSEAIINYLISLIQNYPWAVVLFVGMGVFRTVFKPAMTMARMLVKATPTQVDDEQLEKFEASKLYKSAAWFVDYLFSIKLPGVDNAS